MDEFNQSPFVSAERRDEFTLRLESLLDEFPEIVDRLRRAHAADPTHDRWTDDFGEDFDSDQPIFRTGWVLIVGTSSMQTWEQSHIIAPTQQSHFITTGLIHLADD